MIRTAGAWNRVCATGSRGPVSAVLLLLACAHVGLWALDHKQMSAAAVQGPLESFSYTRLAGSQGSEPNKGGNG